MAYMAEYIWIDGTEPTAKLRSKTKVLADGADLPIWGFDGSSTNQAPGDQSDCVLQPVKSVPDPIRGGDDVLVMCRGAPHRHDAAPDQHPGAARGGRREVRRPGAVVRHRAGVHVPQGRPPARLPVRRLPGPAGRLLLRRRRRRDLRPRRRRGPHAGLHRRRHLDLGHQRRGHARPVGVPGRPARPARGRRPAVAGPLAALPHRRGLRHRRHPRPQAGQGRLERRRCPHQLLDQRDARELRRHHRGLRGARREGRGARRRTTAPTSSTASPACTRRPRGTSSATACRTAVRRCASRGRSRSTRRATSRTAGPTPTWTPTSSPG